MEWFWSRIDVLIAAVFVAGFAIAASQGHAFMTQYQDRLARDVEAARVRVEDVKTGLRYQLMSESVRSELLNTAQVRFNALSDAHTAIAQAGVLKGVTIARRADPALVAEIRRTFVPTLPRSVMGITYAVFGAVAGFIVYELVKFPLMLLSREPRRRRFRRRS